VEWDHGTTIVADRGERTVTLRFSALSGEGRAFQGNDVDYRVTHGIRVDGAAPADIEKIEVFTDSLVRTSRIRVAFDDGKVTEPRPVGWSTYNCDLVSIEGEAGSELIDGREVILPAAPEGRQSFQAEVRHLVSPHSTSHDAGLLTFRTAEDTFTISVDQLSTSGPIWYEPGGVFITLASDSTTLADYRREVLRRRGPPSRDDAAGMPKALGDIAAMVSLLPEQTLAGVTRGQPERQPVAMIVGCKYNRNRYRIETNGDVTMEPRDYASQGDRFCFGLGRWSRVANYSDPAPALGSHVERRRGGLRVHEEAFAVPLLKRVGEDLEADEPTACMLRFTFTNEQVEPAMAVLPIRFSSRATHDKGPYQGHDRTADPAAPNCISTRHLGRSAFASGIPRRSGFMPSP